MKYKLINNRTKEQHLCEKVTIDGFEYYVNEEKLKVKDKFYFNIDGVCDILEVESEFHLEKISSHLENKKVIATNNPNIDIPKVVNEIEKLAFDYHEQVKRNYYSTGQKAQLPKSNKEFQAMGDGFIDGYNKSQEMFPFTEEDMIEFVTWVKEYKFLDGTKSESEYSKTELLQLWKEQQPKIVYYNY